MRICTVCKVEKELQCFNNKKNGRFGKSARCTQCESAYTKLWRKANYEKQLQKSREYKINNREKIREAGKSYYYKTLQYQSQRKKTYRKENPEKVSELQRKRRQRPEVKEQNRQYVKIRRKTNPAFKLRTLIRTRQNFTLKGKLKVSSMVLQLGCTLDELKNYLESKFEPWMTWDNHGVYSPTKKTWHLDHIVPLSKFNLENMDDFKAASHYTNLQPLEAIKNLRKNRYE